MILAKLFRRENFLPLSAAVCCAFLASVADIVLLGTGAYIIAAAAFMPPLYVLSVAITLIRAAGLLRAVFRWLERMTGHKAAFASLTDIRLRIFRNAVHNMALKKNGGVFIRDVTAGADALRDFYSRAVIFPVANFLSAAFGTFFLCRVAFGAGLLLAALFLLHVAIPAVAERKSDAERKTDAAYRNALLDAADTDELIAAGSVAAFQKRLDGLASEKFSVEKKAATRANAVDATLSLLRGLFFAAILFLLLTATNERTISGVWFAVWSLASLGLVGSFAPLSDAVRAFFGAKSVAAQIFAASRMNDSTAAEKNDASPPGLLAAESVGFGYEKNVPVLRHTDFSLAPGDKAAIVGESGSGKTTLARLLLKLVAPTDGRLFIRGTDYRALDEDDVRRAFGASVQGEYVFAGTVRDSFRRLLPDIDDEAIMAAVRAVLLDGRFFDGLDTVLEDDAKNLSGGERNRLKTAFALATGAPIILLDEPAANLDKKTARALLASLENFAAARTLIIISHDADIIGRMDKTIKLQTQPIVSA